MKQITTTELCQMTEREGLILQGCGGELSDWVNGINEMLTKESILQNGSTFTEISTFEHEGCTNLLFHFEGVDLNIGKLAMWRLATHEQFAGTWLSDYLINKFDIDHEQQPTPQEKPDCPLLGADGNVFCLMGIAARTLRKNGLAEQATEMSNRITSSGSYAEALNIMGEYVNITSVDDTPDFEMRQSY